MAGALSVRAGRISAVRAAQHGRRLPERVGERELPEVREAELRVRSAGSSWPRAEVLVDPDRLGTRHRWPAANYWVGGEGAAGGRPACGVRGDQRADRGGEREDLRGRARRWRGCALGAGGRKRGLCDGIAREKAAEIGRLAAEATRSLGCGGAGLEAAEAVIRAGMLQAGCGMLEKLPAADPGYRGPRVPCGQGHEAEFVSYRDKVIDTVLGPVTLTACLVSLRGPRPRACPQGRRARRGRPGDVPRPAGDERPGCRRRAVRESRPAAGEPGRGAPDGQARRAGRRGKRHRGGRQ